MIIELLGNIDIIDCLDNIDTKRHWLKDSIVEKSLCAKLFQKLSIKRIVFESVLSTPTLHLLAREIVPPH